MALRTGAGPKGGFLPWVGPAAKRAPTWRYTLALSPQSCPFALGRSLGKNVLWTGYFSGDCFLATMFCCLFRLGACSPILFFYTV